MHASCVPEYRNAVTTGPARSDPRPTRTCPLYASRLVGREYEVSCLEGKLRPGELTTVVGPGGVGKTRIVSEVVRGSGQLALFVDASTSYDEAGLARAVLRDLRSTEAPPQGQGLLQHAGQVLARAKIPVVVLDNLEQLGAAAGPALQALRQEVADAAWLCTSRVPTLAAGEQVLPLPPLPTHEPDAAVQLFLRALPRLGQTPVDPLLDRPRIEAIVKMLDGLPLAIELAAGRTAVLPLDEIERRLAEAPLGLLQDPARPADRATTIARSIAWSAELLPATARDTLEQIGCFAGPFELSAARRVVELPHREVDVADALQVLVTWNLIRIEPDGRFAPFETIRAFAADALSRRPDRAQVFDRHAQYFLEVAQQARHAPRIEPMLREADELDLAIARGLAPGASAAALSLARRLEEAIDRIENVRRSAPEHRALLERLIAAGPLDREALPLLAYQGLMDLHRGAVMDARQTFERLLSLSLELEDPGKEAQACLQLANVARMEGRPEHVRGLVERALVVARSAGDHEMEMWALGGIVNVEDFSEGRHDEVAARVDQAIALARTLGPFALERMLHLRMHVDLARGDWASTRERLEETRHIHEAAGQVAWFRVQMRLEVEMMLVLAEQGGRGAARVQALLQELPEHVSPPVRARMQVLAGLARHLAGEPLDPALLSAVNPSDLPQQQALLAAALPGRLSAPPADSAKTPVDRALFEASALIGELAAGRLGPGEVEERFSRLSPRTALFHVAGQLLGQHLERVRAESSAWHIASDGSWFLPPAAERVSLKGSPRLARLVAALASARARGVAGLDVSAMFEAGWPAESAKPASQANRVRVAVTTLRGLGLHVLAWERGRGWYLDADVRLSAS
jgi:predicted ATPase